MAARGSTGQATSRTRRRSLACRPAWVAAPTGRRVSPSPSMTIVRACWEPLAWGWGYYRLRTGAGQRVETSLGHAATSLQMPYMQTYEGKVWTSPAATGAGLGATPTSVSCRHAWFFPGAQDAQLERLVSIPGLQAARPCRRAIGSTASALPREASERVGVLVGRGWHGCSHAGQCDAAHARSWSWPMGSA